MMKRALITAITILPLLVRGQAIDGANIRLANPSEKVEQQTISRLFSTIEQLAKSSLSDDDSDTQRFGEVADAGYNWGVNEGLYFHHQQKQDQLVKHQTHLSLIANFSQFVLDGKLLLPIVLSSRQMYEQISDISSRRVSVSYTLFRPARIVDRPPTWRDYLIQPLKKPVPPAFIHMPRTKKERAAFEAAFLRGWSMGKDQAQSALNESFRRLNRDLEGHYLFRILVAQDIVKMPSTQDQNHEVVLSDDGRTIFVNQVISTIDSQSAWETTSEWKPVFSNKVKQ